jgi:acyl carrier protein
MWRRALGYDQLTVDDDFFESGGDSLLATKLLLEIEKLTGKKLPISIIFETGTIRELLKRIELADVQSPILGNEKGNLLHLFHGDFNFGGVPVKYCLKMLGNDHGIHVIPPHIPKAGDPLISIEEMAREHLQSVLDRQPQGPYILVGHCNGSCVAFEMARLLVSMGKEVKAVAMLDPIITSVRRSAQGYFKLQDFLMRPRGVPEKERRERLVLTWKKMYEWNSKTKDTWRLTHLKSLCKNMLPGHCRFFDIPQPVRYIFHRSWRERIALIAQSQAKGRKRSGEMVNTEDAYERFKYYWNVLFDYKPLPLDVPVIYASIEYSGRAWRRVAPHTAFVNICRGTHNFWEEDYMPYIFNKLREFIDR